MERADESKKGVSTSGPKSKTDGNSPSFTRRTSSPSSTCFREGGVVDASSASRSTTGTMCTVTSGPVSAASGRSS